MNPHTRRKIQTPMDWLQAVRQDFAKELRKEGLNYRATNRKDRDLLQQNTKQKHQAWILQKAKQFYGKDGLRFLRKALIEQRHKDPKKADRAKQVLTAFRKIKQPAQQQFFEEKLQIYSQQYHKYQLKQIAKNQAQVTGLAEKVGEKYVNQLFARRQKFLDQAHSNNQPVLKSLQEVENQITVLQKTETAPEVKPKIIQYAEHHKAQQQANYIIQKCSHYGEIGKIFLQKEFLKLTRTQDPEQKKASYQRIKKCLKGQFSAEFMKDYLWQQTSQKLRVNAKQQIATYTEQVALAAQVKPTEVRLIHKLYQALLLNSVHNPSLAYANFEKSLQDYTKALALNDPSKLKQLEQALKQRLKYTPDKQPTQIKKTQPTLSLE